MMYAFFLRLIVFTVLFISVFSGCGITKPSMFYTLNSLNATEKVKSISPETRSISIMLNPVDIPDYLDRSNIVTRSSQNKLEISEYHRWGGSLQEDIMRVLAENLSILLSQNNVNVIMFKIGVPVDYKMTVDLVRFDIMSDKNVLLKSHWTVTGKDGKIVVPLQGTELIEKVSGTGYSAQVDAMSHALEKLSREMAEKIESLIHEAK